ncbi:MAG: 7-carboxy-7-deazaguanine synthase QueE [Candidatus Omnitrophica bacterium]|nr:7-carboxy-7-deazaguanine synthase QueE [Candidatus Omnitrophota bacterium]
MKAKITEIFDSIQGEGIYLGVKQLFVRFYGCNLKCGYCDTKPEKFREYEPAELVSELKIYGDKYHSVSFTGGEPLLQIDFLKEVLRLTRQEGFKNYLETNGTLPDQLEQVIDLLDFVAMDFKFPSSTGLADFWQQHKSFLRIASRKEVFLKAIICSATREDDLMEAIKLLKELRSFSFLVLQPNSLEDGLELRTKLNSFRNICSRENIAACVIPQMHKLIGVM